MMAKCSHCGTDTILHENGVPICVKCAENADLQRKPQQREESPLEKPAQKIESE
jgi:uncharacterized Zn ribbon protein